MQCMSNAVRKRNYYPWGYQPARSSGVHCDVCDIVFAAPAPQPDIDGKRICWDCQQKHGGYRIF